MPFTVHHRRGRLQSFCEYTEIYAEYECLVLTYALNDVVLNGIITGHRHAYRAESGGAPLSFKIQTAMYSGQIIQKRIHRGGLWREKEYPFSYPLRTPHVTPMFVTWLSVLTGKCDIYWSKVLRQFIRGHLIQDGEDITMKYLLSLFTESKYGNNTKDKPTRKMLTKILVSKQRSGWVNVTFSSGGFSS